ncbi:hypothetical protein BCR44DRAFT_1425003 [Catenaria anguillulae PL171]|uniref:Uncharacterized protein n=1 Tax=Catenaria anguillulae PL171 TaxID=765915 RepID=A0A1Y2I0M7_9FUNG|nr:hypothetical protein BCR44DRAFT_1425003 [Catenaria anguillulae PL171]
MRATSSWKKNEIMTRARLLTNATYLHVASVVAGRASSDRQPTRHRHSTVPPNTLECGDDAPHAVP